MVIHVDGAHGDACDDGDGGAGGVISLMALVQPTLSSRLETLRARLPATQTF